jgi:Mrp family chromosome partitioning ATPase
MVSKHKLAGIVFGLGVCWAMAALAFACPAARPLVITLWLALAAAGLVVGFCLPDPAVRRITDVFSILPLPVAGWIEAMPGGGRAGDVLPGLGRVRDTVHGWLHGRCRQILVTSGDARDGKSLVATGLALDLAQQGLRVTVVDVHPRNPSLHETFMSPRSPGLAEHLDCPLAFEADDITHMVNETLHLIPAGAAPLVPEALEGETFKKLVRSLEGTNDVIIFDGAAACDSPQALTVLNGDVHVLAVVRMGHTDAGALRELSAQLCGRDTAGTSLVFFDADEAGQSPACSVQSDSASENHLS